MESHSFPEPLTLTFCELLGPREGKDDEAMSPQRHTIL